MPKRFIPNFRSLHGMKNGFLCLSLVLLLFACQKPQSGNGKTNTTNSSSFTLYSSAVQDSFYLQVSKPLQPAIPTKKIPLLLVLDANLYFQPASAMVTSFGEVGLVPEAMVVGVGYQNFRQMDSLRSRDYTFPKALPEYEMEPSGGAPAFLQFLKTELIPELRKRFPNSGEVSLYGHSLGGFFCLYALKEQWQSGDATFSGFVAASPALHYNQYALLGELEQLATDSSKKQSAQVFVGFGSKEDDPEEKEALPVAEVLSRLEALDPSGEHIKTGLFSPLEHMETPLPVLQRGWVEVR